MFLENNFLYTLTIDKDNICEVTWVEDGEINKNKDYSIETVCDNFNSGVWVKINGKETKDHQSIDKVIKQILSIIGKDELGSMLKIVFYGNEVWFEIYENSIPVIIDMKTKEVYLDTEASSHHLTGDMLSELSQIVKTIENNIETIVECLEVD